MRLLTAFAVSFIIMSLSCGNLENESGALVRIDQDQDGVTPAGGDCDDANPDVNGQLAELPYDGIDNDCSSATPDDDLDGDGFALAEDCDDRDATSFPGAQETCDSIDHNCNDDPDDNLFCSEPTDNDGDGVFTPEDCNDNNASIPAPSDTCGDGLDNDCNGLIDDGPLCDCEPGDPKPCPQI